MIILGIETSCDETAVSVVKAEGEINSPSFTLLGNGLYTQTIHSQYGGVYPNMAKREHAKNLLPLLEKALTEAEFLKTKENKTEVNEKDSLQKILAREDNLGPDTIAFLEKYEKPDIDAIAVTVGPGLEPALWVGVSFAKALALAWNIPVIPTNHMEGHLASVLMTRESTVNSQQSTEKRVQFPAIALLISGGHTEIVNIEKWGSYSILGQTRDDAVGEAFDKVARMLGLPYPGGPEVSKLAEKARSENLPHTITLPRPMLHSNDLDFSFSGLKTSVLYKIRDIGPLTDDMKAEIAREFEDTVVDVLVSKTKKALLESGAKSLIVAGGVIANKKIREAFSKLISEKYPDVSLFIPENELSTDNAVMISLAAYIEILVHPKLLTEKADFRAIGNLKLS